MNDDRPDSTVGREPEHVLDPSNLEAERHAMAERLHEALDAADDAAVSDLVHRLTPGDLSEILRLFSVADTVRVLRRLDPEPLAEVLVEIDNRSQTALFTLLGSDEIADILEEMPSDDATDLLGEMEEDQQREVLAAMEAEERDDVEDLLRYAPETAGGLMRKEFLTCFETETCGDAVSRLREWDMEELEQMHFVYVVDANHGHLVGRLPLFRLLLLAPTVPVREVMEPDPLYVEVDLDQEDVAQFMATHDLITLPVVHQRHRLVGVVTIDDALDVVEEEATEDISRMAGVSVHEFGESSSFRVARSRIPWLLGALAGEMGSIMILHNYEAGLQAMVALAFFIPAIMAMGGNTGMQTSSVVVRGLATGEVGFYKFGRHLARELGTALITGGVLAASLALISWLVLGDLHLAWVLALAMVAVILMASLVGTGMPLLLHRIGVDPAVATGPFITTFNDVFGLLIYLSIAFFLLELSVGR